MVGDCQESTINGGQERARLQNWRVYARRYLENSENGRPRCQIISGKAIDQAVSKLIVESVNPLALEVALSVQKELQSRLEEADRLRRAQVERARFDAEQAQRRSMRVDPANRLVADSWEADWNAKLRALQEAETHTTKSPRF
jgi:hypothetical protein